MAKEKKSTIDKTKKEKMFFYEILGIVSLLVAFISFARLGLIGQYAMLTFRFLFGDWYFVFIILLGVYGLYCLLVHHKIEIKSIRYYGILLILLSLLVLTHFSMHHFVSNYEGNSFMLTVNLYLDYFKNYRPDMMQGGGMIGAVLFYIFYYLLSSVGTIIVSVILFFIGIVFLCKKTIRDFFEMIIEVSKKIGLFSKESLSKIKKNFVKLSEEYEHKPRKPKTVKKIFVNNDSNTKNTSLDRSEQIVVIIKDAFNHLEIPLENITYLICLHIIVFFISTKQEINYRVLEHALLKVIKEPFMIKFDQYNKQVIVEVNKEVPLSLSFKDAYNLISKQSFTAILGMDDRNLLVELDGNALIVGDNTPLLRKYFISLFTFCLIQKTCNIESLEVIDLNSSLSDYCFHSIKQTKNKSRLEEICHEVDNNLELLNMNHKIDVEDYNMTFSKKIVKKIYFIYGIEEVLYDKGYFEKLLYIVQTGKMAGINTVLVLSSEAVVSNVLLSGIEYKILLENKFSITDKLMSGNYFSLISNDVEGFLKYRDLIMRISLLLLCNEEIEKYYPFNENKYL